MMTGDNILGHGSSGYEDLGVYQTTLEKMKQEFCAVGYPAHGATVRDLKGKIAMELGQKRRRETQLISRMKILKQDAMQSGGGNSKGSASVKELVIAVHGQNIAEQVRTEILEPFTDEILRKLAGEGKVGFEITGGEKRWFICGVA